MYARIVNGSVEEFPYSIKKLKIDNPNTSFPKSLVEDTLASHNVYEVIDVSSPEISNSQIAYHTGDAVQVDGKWQREWATRDKTSDEITEENNRLASETREQRTKLLAETDFYALSDVTMSDAMKAYRQALRDVPAQEGFPSDINWPTLGE